MDRRPPLPALSANLLWGRAVVLATVGLGTGTVSHLAGGGRLPGPAAMMLLLAAGVPLATLFLRRRVGRTALVLLVATGQTLTHGLLAALAGHRGDATATGPVVLPRRRCRRAAGDGAAACTTSTRPPSRRRPVPAPATAAGGRTSCST
ncbi:hypothetical protein [Nocardioides houyundeii]|uniref:hypothetical protein n=1 Tax=Nocardioides houyundeii TaxID=2045452 RepID=UPI000C76BEB2|nr:hypothetical protein [Nocardioides houyundeii]